MTATARISRFRGSNALLIVAVDRSGRLWVQTRFLGVAGLETFSYIYRRKRPTPNSLWKSPRHASESWHPIERFRLLKQMAEDARPARPLTTGRDRIGCQQMNSVAAMRCACSSAV